MRSSLRRTPAEPITSNVRVESDVLVSTDQKGVFMTKKHWTMILPGALLLGATPAGAIELKDAVQAALNSNPEIRQAVSNKAATREERIQAEGEYAPKVNIELSAGARNLRNPTRRSIGIEGETLYPVEGDANFEIGRAHV